MRIDRKEKKMRCSVCKKTIASDERVYTDEFRIKIMCRECALKALDEDDLKDLENK